MADDVVRVYFFARTYVAAVVDHPSRRLGRTGALPLVGVESGATVTHAVQRNRAEVIRPASSVPIWHLQLTSSSKVVGGRTARSWRYSLGGHGDRCALAHREPAGSGRRQTVFSPDVVGSYPARGTLLEFGELHDSSELPVLNLAVPAPASRNSAPRSTQLLQKVAIVQRTILYKPSREVRPHVRTTRSSDDGGQHISTSSQAADQDGRHADGQCEVFDCPSAPRQSLCSGSRTRVGSSL